MVTMSNRPARESDVRRHALFDHMDRYAPFAEASNRRRCFDVSEEL
jgi:hypothetical protein